jgi:hypothetical protein
VLEFNSFKLGSSELWCPKVLLKDLREKKVIPLFWDKTLCSKEEANKYAEQKINEYLSQFLEADL